MPRKVEWDTEAWRWAVHMYGDRAKVAERLARHGNPRDVMEIGFVHCGEFFIVGVGGNWKAALDEAVRSREQGITHYCRTESA